MTSRLKEDEKNERAIRNLLRLPENRRCINCNSLGPQYVCANFWTFVCTTCSGIHREFTHRVKSVSMAKFTSQEVSALQGGGNASAKEIYFKDWDPQLQSLPDSSNIERLRDFIKHVYVDRRYSGEKSFDKPPRAKMGEGEESYQGGSRSPAFENELRYSDRPSPGARSDYYDERQSPGYDQNFRSPPAPSHSHSYSQSDLDRLKEIFRADRMKFSDGGAKVEGKSPDGQKDPDMSSPPVVRPVREILGEKVSPLRVIEPPKNDGSFRTRRSASSGSLASSNRSPITTVPEPPSTAVPKTESSLIDFDDFPEPPSTAQVPQIQHTAPSQPTPSSFNSNWANFDSVQQVKASNPPSNTNLLDVLSDLSVPSSAPGGSFFPSNAIPPAGPLENIQSSPFGPTATTVSAPISHSTFAPVGSQEATPGPSAFANRELPADLFTSSYVNFAGVGQGWYPAPQYGMGYNMQYNYNVPQTMPPAYMQQPSRPSNPFDVHEPSSAQAPTFPSMGPLQGALPNMLPPAGIHRTSSLGTFSPPWTPAQPSHHLPSTIQRTSSLGAPLPAWTPAHSSNPLSMPPQLPPYGSPMPSGQFMGQTPPNMPPPPRPQGGGFGSDYGSYDLSQQQSGPSFSSTGGNPFG